MDGNKIYNYIQISVSSGDLHVAGKDLFLKRSVVHFRISESRSLKRKERTFSSGWNEMV